MSYCEGVEGRLTEMVGKVLMPDTVGVVHDSHRMKAGGRYLRCMRMCLLCNPI